MTTSEDAQFKLINEYWLAANYLSVGQVNKWEKKNITFSFSLFFKQNLFVRFLMKILFEFPQKKIHQIYLLANPLLRTPLELKHIKARLLGHWGTTRNSDYFCFLIFWIKFFLIINSKKHNIRSWSEFYLCSLESNYQEERSQYSLHHWTWSCKFIFSFSE